MIDFDDQRLKEVQRDSQVALYPAFLRLQGRLCTVIGGGKVALRKVESLLVSKALVRVISPVAEDRLLELANRGIITYEKRCYQAGDAASGYVVIAATNNQNVNRQIAMEADQCGRLVNVVDDPERCSFQVPASFTLGDVGVAISTNGKDPMAAKHLKNILMQDLIEEKNDFQREVRQWITNNNQGIF